MFVTLSAVAGLHAMLKHERCCRYPEEIGRCSITSTRPTGSKNAELEAQLLSVLSPSPLLCLKRATRRKAG